MRSLYLKNIQRPRLARRKRRRDKFQAAPREEQDEGSSLGRDARVLRLLYFLLLRGPVSGSGHSGYSCGQLLRDPNAHLANWRKGNPDVQQILDSREQLGGRSPSEGSPLVPDWRLPPFSTMKSVN
eukprot:GHVU01215582.1.p2 GENE.GHVU01215582.1~~GHVU01215582.1.p2  ORF type:complete len:126 (+),score=8.20 GHVU01215582.1:428-805(+)